jgi:DNA-binding CsgD family transcriptional regulator
VLPGFSLLPGSFPPGPNDRIDSIRRVVSSSLRELAPAFSAMLMPTVTHGALVLFTEECIGRPQKVAGDPAVTDRVTIAELDVIRAGMSADGSPLWNEIRTIGGLERPISAWLAATGSLLVLTDPALPDPALPDPAATDLTTDPMPTATTLQDAVAAVASSWELVALSIRQQVIAAPPAYLAESRSESAERSRVIAELTAVHATTLESMLAVLRSRKTGDLAARQAASELAASAMVRLRAVSDRDRILSEEPVAKAFERLRSDLNPLIRFGDLDVQFVEPPVSGRALPGEVAHGARAIVQGAVLALVEEPSVQRVRVQWNCDGHNLLISIRDDGPGDLTANDPTVTQLAARIAALDGSLRVDATAGWGSELAVTIPLDAPAFVIDGSDWGLSTRELSVLELVMTGARNRAIATSLSISESTVKFHVARLLRKLGASTRAEIVAIARTEPRRSTA